MIEDHGRGQAVGIRADPLPHATGAIQQVSEKFGKGGSIEQPQPAHVER